jgi:hypothetical protein
MEEIGDLNDELCSPVFIKNKSYLAKLNREILSWCRCGKNAAEKGSFLPFFRVSFHYFQMSGIIKMIKARSVTLGWVCLNCIHNFSFQIIPITVMF